MIQAPAKKGWFLLAEQMVRLQNLLLPMLGVLLCSRVNSMVHGRLPERSIYLAEPSGSRVNFFASRVCKF
jgi:hypothetical protein